MELSGENITMEWAAECVRLAEETDSFYNYILGEGHRALALSRGTIEWKYDERGNTTWFKVHPPGTYL